MMRPKTEAGDAEVSAGKEKTHATKNYMTKADNEGAGMDKNNTTTTSSNVILKDNSESLLLKLPNEIKQRIWILAVTEDEPIRPRQLKAKSNKFVWSKSQANKGNTKDILAVPQLAAVQLSKVCRVLYEEVALTHLFYRVNSFELSCQETLITYVVAITEARMKAIRSIQVALHFGRWAADNDKAFTLLQACEGLQRVALFVPWSLSRWPSPAGLEELRGVKELVAALHGPKEFTINTTEFPQGHAVSSRDKQDLDNTQAFCVKATAYLKKQLEVSEGKPIKISKLRRAQELANLNIYGEGRLGEDKRPGVVSSRTRRGVRSIEALNPDGTLAEKLRPKYDLEGELSWYIVKIEASREITEDDETPSVQFLVECTPTPFQSWEKRSGFPNATSLWEGLAALASQPARDEIAGFYNKNRNAPGIRLVADAWKHLPNDWRKKDLQRLIHAQDAKAAKEAARAAAVEAKRAKAETKANNKLYKGKERKEGQQN